MIHKQNTRQDEIDATIDAIREKYGDAARRYRSGIRVAEGILEMRKQELAQMIEQQAEDSRKYPGISYEGRKVWNEWQNKINAQRQAVEQAKIDLSNARLPKSQADEFNRYLNRYK